jgi:hypothetical protein
MFVVVLVCFVAIYSQEEGLVLPPYRIIRQLYFLRQTLTII